MNGPRPSGGHVSKKRTRVDDGKNIDRRSLEPLREIRGLEILIPRSIRLNPAFRSRVEEHVGAVEASDALVEADTGRTRFSALNKFLLDYL